MEYNINELKRQQDELLSRLGSLSVESPQGPYNDSYSDIENAANKLSDTDKQELLKDAKYQDMVSKLNIFIQQEQFRLIRESLNKNPEAISIMKNIADYIVEFKNTSDKHKAETLKLFEEYITNYADMSYADFLKTKI